MIEIDIIPLAGHEYFIEIEDRPDELGPLSKAELVALRDALIDFLGEGY